MLGASGPKTLSPFGQITAERRRIGSDELTFIDHPNSTDEHVSAYRFLSSALADAGGAF